MTFSQDCIDLIKASEGCRLTAYQDSTGVWTIGYGHTGPEVTMGLTWSQEQVDVQLAADLQIHCEQMQGVVTVPLSQGQIDALTDFTFNEGIGTLKKSTLLTLLNSGQYNQVPNQLYRVDDEGKPHGYIFAGGVVLPGLITRRQKEIELWNSEPEPVAA